MHYQYRINHQYIRKTRWLRLRSLPQDSNKHNLMHKHYSTMSTMERRWRPARSFSQAKSMSISKSLWIKIRCASVLKVVLGARYREATSISARYTNVSTTTQNASKITQLSLIEPSSTISSSFLRREVLSQSRYGSRREYLMNWRRIWWSLSERVWITRLSLIYISS